jgi:hypothetical protein
MADLERVAVRVSDGLRTTLSRVSSLAVGIAGITAVIGLATFLTGLWAFEDSRATWTVIGAIICFAPTAAVLLAWFFVRTTLKVAPALLGNVRTFIDDSRGAANALINYDTGERLAISAKTVAPLRTTLRARKDLPALYATIRAISTVPALAAIALLGTLFVGALGTILLIVAALN